VTGDSLDEPHTYFIFAIGTRKKLLSTIMHEMKKRTTFQSAQ